MLCVVGTTHVNVVRAPVVVSSVVIIVISCKNVQRKSRVVVMGTIKLNFLQLLDTFKLSQCLLVGTTVRRKSPS